jgi:branched-chain amino acid transport system substrate-binding protein
MRVFAYNHDQLRFAIACAEAIAKIRRRHQLQGHSKFIWAPLALSLALIGQARAQALPDTIKLGMLFSLTGGNAANGVSGVAGTKLAVEEINKAGGIAGKQIVMVISDDQTDSAKAVSEALRLAANEKVNIVTGPLTSQLTLAVGPTFTQAKIFQMTGAGSSTLTPQVLPYHFSMAAPADVEAPIMVDYAVDVLKAKTIAWLGDNGAIDKSMLEGIKVAAQKRNVQLVKEQEYAYRGDDVTPQVLSVKRANPDALLMRPNSGEDHGLVMRTINEVGWNVPVINGAGSSASPGPAVKIFPDAYKGLVNLTYKSWTYCSNDAVGETPLGKYKAKLKAATGPEYDKLAQNFSAQAYDSVYIMKAAIEATKSVDGSVLAKWLEQNAKTLKGTVNGPFDASSSSHFLAGSREGMAFAIDPDKPRADGLFKRAGC